LLVLYSHPFSQPLAADPALPKKAKAFYRRGVALHRLGRLQDGEFDENLWEFRNRTNHVDVWQILNIVYSDIL
jgi:hypothetical protein